jgi:hypothetical protein
MRVRVNPNIVSADNSSAESLGRCDVLGLHADPPARELEKFFALGTEFPAQAGMTSLRAGVRPACAKASAEASGQVLLLRTVVSSQ